MEERPRFGQEQPAEDDSSEDTGSSRRRIRMPIVNSEGYWAKLIEPPKEEVAKNEKKTKKSEKEKEDEEDDDDDEKPVIDASVEKPKESSGWIGRYERFKGLFNRNLLSVEGQETPDSPASIEESPEEVEPVAAEDLPEHYETWSPDAVKEIVDQAPEVDHEEASQDTLEDDNGIQPDQYFDASTLRPYIEQAQPEAPENAPVEEPNIIERGQQPEETPNDPIDEPESIHDILQRRQREETLSSEPVQTESKINKTVEIHNDKYTNTGLHLLNYGLALRRDKRNQAINRKEFKRLDEELDVLKQKPIETKTGELKQQQYYEVPAATVNPAAQRLDQLKPFENTKNVEKTSVIPEQNKIQSELVEKRLQELIEKAKPETAMSAQEAFMKQVAEAVENKTAIQSELAYERRHEVKDNQGIPITSDQYGLNAVDSLPAQNVQNIYSPEIYKDPTVVNNKKIDPVVYQQAAVSGVLGALVGIIIFISFYMLTKG